MPTVHSTRDSSAWTIRINGDLLSTNAKEVRAVVNDLLTEPEKFSKTLKTLLLDLSTAKMIDSVGLNLIVAILRATKQAGGAMKIRHDNPNVQRILLFTRLDQQLEILKAA
ncbi:MAG: STAS domain-containing protein [Phycisphaerae bacterium]|jgi:anti-anti-sigma factor|nr:STAS domain-containing protein [Phycisphaerae bacterium]